MPTKNEIAVMIKTNTYFSFTYCLLVIGRVKQKRITVIIFIITDRTYRKQSKNKSDISNCRIKFFRHDPHHRSDDQKDQQQIFPIIFHNFKSLIKSPFTVRSLLSSSQSIRLQCLFPLQYPDNFRYNIVSLLSDRHIHNVFPFFQQIPLVKFLKLLFIYFQQSVLIQKYIRIFMKDNPSFMNHIKYRRTNLPDQKKYGN